jgi:hypothetical protein
MSQLYLSIDSRSQNLRGYRKINKARRRNLDMEKQLSVLSFAFFVILLVSHSAIPSLSEENQDTQNDVMCTEIYSHYCIFYRLCLTKPVIKGLDQENLTEILEELKTGKSGVEFPEESELNELKAFIENGLKEKNEEEMVEYEFDIKVGKSGISPKADLSNRYFIRIEPRGPQYSDIAFEYDGVHLDMILSVHNELPLENLEDELQHTPDFEVALDMRHTIEVKIDDYFFERFSQNVPENITNSPTEAELFTEEWEYSEIYFKYMSKQSQKPFRKNSFYFQGFDDSYDISKIPEEHIDWYIDAALAYHFETLVQWEGQTQDTQFSTELGKINTIWPCWYGDEIKKLETTERNLLSLKEALPVIFGRLEPFSDPSDFNSLSPASLGLLEDRLKRIDSLQEKVEMRYTIYINRRTQSLAIVGIVLGIFAILLSIVSYFRKKKKNQKSEMQRNWKTMLYVFVIIALIGFCSYKTRDEAERTVQKEFTSEEQKTYALELIAIHEDFVDELSRGRLLIRQSFFLVVTGLLFYYYIRKKDGTNTSMLGKRELLILLVLATFLCHFHEGILNYWQAEHLNKICVLEGALDSAEFQDWFQNQHIYRYKNLPFSEDPDFGPFKALKSHILFMFSIHLNASSIAFYFLTLLAVCILIRCMKTDNESKKESSTYLQAS